MTLPYIVPIIGLLAAVYFVSHQEEKSKTNKEFKAYKSVRPALKYLAATQNINLSDEEIKQLHKTMNEAAKTMGAEYFKNKISPKINTEIKKAVSMMDADSTQNDLSKLVMKTVNTQVKGILKKHKSESTKSESLPGRDSVEVLSPGRTSIGKSKSLPGRDSLELYSPPPKRIKFTSSTKGSKRKKRNRTTKKSKKSKKSKKKSRTKRR